MRIHRSDDTVVSKHVVNLKVEIIKAYVVVCMTEVLKSNSKKCVLKLKVSEVKLGKFNPRRGCEGPEEEERYSSTLSLISAIDGSG